MVGNDVIVSEGANSLTRCLTIGTIWNSTNTKRVLIEFPIPATLLSMVIKRREVVAKREFLKYLF